MQQVCKTNRKFGIRTSNLSCKRLFCNISGILCAIIIGIVLAVGGCTGPGNEGFAIYLTKNDIPPSQM